LEIFFPLSIRQLCKLFPILPTVLPHILAYALPFLFSVFPCLMFHFPLLKSFQRIHLSSNRAVILCNILVFCHPTPNIECHPFLAVCHYLLIIFAATLHIWKLSPPSSGWFSRKMIICFRFSNVTFEMELKCGMWLNINWGNLQPLTMTGSSELPVFFFVPWSWRLQVCRRVSYGLPCYMGHICGLQCYDQLGRLCAVRTVQKKTVDHFVVEQSSWKVTFRSSSQEVPSFNGKWTFLPLWAIVTSYQAPFFMIGCHPSITHM